MNRAGTVIIGAAAIALSGCHMFHNIKSGCHGAQDYQHVHERPALRIPAGFTAPNTVGALVVPPLLSNAPPRGPREPCLEEPPKYRAAPPSKPLPAS